MVKLIGINTDYIGWLIDYYSNLNTKHLAFFKSSFGVDIILGNEYDHPTICLYISRLGQIKIELESYKNKKRLYCEYFYE
jgi:hypothetical protein